MGLRYLLATVFILSAFATAPAHANVDPDQTNPTQETNYVETARSAALGAVNSFNEQDRIASAAAGKGANGQGIYLNSAQAIVQYQRQYTAAGKLIEKLTLALDECIAAADAEIKAAKAALAEDEDNSAAKAKLAKAEANKIECKEHIGPMIEQAKQAKADVVTAAQGSGFTLSAAAGSIGAAKFVAPASPAGAADQTYVVEEAKPIDTSTLEFWSTGDGTYPGSTQTTQSLIDKSEDQAGLFETAKAAVKLGAILYGLTTAPTESALQAQYMQVQQRRPDLSEIIMTPQITFTGK